MNRRVVLGIFVVLLLVIVAVGAGGVAYRIGIAQGLAANPQLVAPQGNGGVPVAPFYYGAPGFYGRPFGFGGFGFLGCLFPLLGIFLLFGLMRAIFWGGRGWGGRRGWGGHGWGGPEGQGVPPMFDEWHKRAHGEQPPQAPTQPAQ
jgi:hypothetical protein